MVQSINTKSELVVEGTAFDGDADIWQDHDRR